MWNVAQHDMSSCLKELGGLTGHVLRYSPRFLIIWLKNIGFGRKAKFGLK